MIQSPAGGQPAKRSRAAANTAASSASSVCSPSGPSSRIAPFNLDSDASMPMPMNNEHAPGLALTAQAVVDYLYIAARDVAGFLNAHCPSRWFAHWGTALGAIRDGGLIPYDFDIDFVVLVDGEDTWPYFKKLSEWVTARGHALYNAGRTCIKVHPPTPRVPCLYVEHFHRAAEESKRDNLRWDLGKLAHVAKQREKSGAPLYRTGRNVVDIEFAAPMLNRKGGLFRLPGAPRGAEIADLVPPRLVSFGPLSLPVPRKAEDVLQVIYPPGPDQPDCLATRRYRTPLGVYRSVPDDVPRCALPSVPL